MRSHEQTLFTQERLKLVTVCSEVYFLPPEVTDLQRIITGFLPNYNIRGQRDNAFDSSNYMFLYF